MARSDVYLHWSPDGTAFDHLRPGDVVQLWCSGPRGFAGVSVVEAQALPAGAGGWVDARAFER